MATAGALEDQELMSEGKNLSLQRCTSLKGLPSRRKQRENDHKHVAEKLQRRPPKFNQFSQNGVFGRDNPRQFQTVGIPMTEERKHAILFAATLLSARKLIEMEPDKPNMAKRYVVDRAIADAAFILERIDKRWPQDSG